AKPLRVPNPVNRAYEKLLMCLNRLERLIELDAPPIILRNDERMTQQAFDALCEMVVAPPDGDPSVWEPGRPMPTQIELRRPGALTPEEEELYSWRDEPPALRLIWRDADELLIQQGERLAIASPSDGAVRHTVVLPRFVTATLLDRDARYLLLLDEYNQVSETAEGEDRPTRYWSGLAVYDLLERAFCERYPDTLTQTSLQHAEPEDGWLVKARSGEHLAVMEQADRPTLNAYTRDGGFIWVSDGMDEGEVIDTESGLVHLTTCGADQTPSIWLQEDGSVVVTDERSDDERDALEDAWNEARDDSDLAHSAAIGRSAAGVWCWVDTNGDLFCPEPRLRLAFPFAATAFDPQLERLAVATHAEVLVISLGEVPTVLFRWPLPPLDPPERE
ncbi:MAG: hypothetical protein KC609_15340, partial [Myxococcales bacterium]|nr:hypothetical protein [Myxococcales bacterium]